MHLNPLNTQNNTREKTDPNICAKYVNMHILYGGAISELKVRHDVLGIFSLAVLIQSKSSADHRITEQTRGRLN